MFSTILHLVTSLTQILPSSEHQPEKTLTTRLTAPTNPFPIATLPFELRQLIYTFYIASLPPINITTSKAHLAHDTSTSLSLSSPTLFSFPPRLFYQNTTFEFSCPQALKDFAASASEKRHVRNVRIRYGRYDGLTRDWVFLLAGNFEGLREVTFVIDGEKERGMGTCGKWWGCVRDAFREGVDGGKGGMRLRVENGECDIEETIA